MAKENNTGDPLVVTRIFNAPVELVWTAWTEPKQFSRWWGPEKFDCPFCEIDLRVGGKYLNCMRSADGQEYWTTGVYREIIPFKRLVYTDCFADEKGNIVPSTYYGMEGFPLELEVTVNFEELNGKTKMVLTHIGLPAGKLHDMTGDGWSESFDKMEEIVK